MTLTSLAQKNKIFFSLFSLWVIACALILLLTQHGDEILFVEQNRSPFLNNFFKLWTNTGEGLFFVAFSLSFLFFSYRYAILSMIIYAVSGLLAQFLKNIVYGPIPRPFKYFENIQEIKEIKGVEGVEMHSLFSFPSGHAVTAFALFAFIAFLSKNKYGFIWIIFAVLAALSRIYLCQHFLIDTFAGSVIGTVTCMVFWVWSSHWKWFQNPKLDGGFFRKK